MWIIQLQYTAPLERIEEFLEEHRAYLRKYYDEGVFLASGPQVPRVGGVILAHGVDRERLEQVLVEDPFHREELVAVQVLAFTPSMSSPAMKAVLEQGPSQEA